MTTRQALEFARGSLPAYAIGLAGSRGAAYEVAQHHRFIARKLEAVERGEISHLMVFAPPRHGKTELVSKYFASWFLGRHSERQIIATSYNQDVADDIGRKVLDCVRDPFHLAAFPTCILRRDSKSVSRFETTKGGRFFAVGAGGPLTSRGAHLLIVDDPIKGREEAYSETIRKRKQEWFISDAYSRREKGAATIVINTRWHEDDLSGWLLREHADMGWDVVSLPALAESGDVLGRELDEPLWPERYDRDWLEGIKRAGSANWASLYQQRPVPEGGGMLNEDWWKYYAGAPEQIARSCEIVVASWDCAFKGTATSDFVVGGVLGQRGADFFLLDLVRGRWDFPATQQRVREVNARWRPWAHLIEDKANGPAVIASLGREIPRLIAIDPQGGKEARVAAISGLVEAGNVWIPQAAAWVSEFREECKAFPAGANDDQVDMLSQGLVWLENRPRPVRRALGNLAPG